MLNDGILPGLLLAAILVLVVYVLKTRASRRVLDRDKIELQKRLEETISKHEGLQRAQDAYIRQLDATRSELLATTTARGQAEQDLAVLKKRLAVAESSLADAVREGERISVTVTGLKACLSEKDYDLAQARKQVEDLDSLSNQIAERDTELRELESHHAQAIHERDAQLIALRARLRDLDPLPKRIKEQSAALHDLNSQLAKVQAENTQLVSRCDELKRLSDDLHAQVNDLSTARQDDQATFEAQLSDLETLNVSLRLGQTKVQALENLLHEAEEREAAFKLSEARLHEFELLPAQLADRDNQLASLSVLLKEREGGLDRLRQRILSLEAELSRVSQEKGLEIEQLRERSESLEPLSGQLAELAARHQELKDRHQWLVNEKDAEIQRLRTRLGELEPLGGALAERDVRLRDLEHTLSRVRGERDAEMRQLQQRISELESLARKTMPETPDDLKLIHGVGPTLARKLNGLGIFRFRNIALWTETEIDQIDAQLEHFRGRIRREGWVQSAREEHFKKYGEWL